MSSLGTTPAIKSPETTQSASNFSWPILGKFNLPDQTPETAKQLCELECDSMDGEKGCLFFHLKKEKVNYSKP